MLLAAQPCQAEPQTTQATQATQATTPLLDELQQLVVAGEAKQAARLLGSSAWRADGAGPLLDGLSPWVLHPDPELAQQALRALDLLVGDPLRPWEPDGAVQRAAERVRAVAASGETPPAVCIAALGVLGTLSDVWGLPAPVEPRCAAAASDDEGLREALDLLRPPAQASPTLAPPP